MESYDQSPCTPGAFASHDAAFLAKGRTLNGAAELRTVTNPARPCTTGLSRQGRPTASSTTIPGTSILRMSPPNGNAICRAKRKRPLSPDSKRETHQVRKIGACYRCQLLRIKVSAQFRRRFL
ncbi:hypothetical protein BDY21DRAFT_53882 [Lineolata rhizophorae]|uniref:Uncharacterized protein n=1 Tax=Lineolata rhizophorae TaxID=578093 RepID=A0A6A6NYM7_9PEZI|nr:hypothetical protein BDY21DRAFT_53882 [Lineolata rhizophorae]